MKKRLSQIKKTVLLTVTALGLLAGMFIINEITIYVRVNELKSSLLINNNKENNIDYLVLVTRYRIYKNLYEKKISLHEADTHEYKLKLVSLQVKQRSTRPKTAYAVIAKPVVQIINGIRLVSGKPPIQEYSKVNTYIQLLDIAYYHERNAQYSEAVTTYNKILSNVPENEKKSHTTGSILLHQAFCNAIIGNYKTAKDQYLNIIKLFKNEKIAITASLLLQYLNNFEKEIKKVMRENDSLEKGEKLYNLIAYKEAMKTFNTIEKNIPPSERPRLKYYKAKTMEALDRKNDAVTLYQEIINESPGSEYAKSANRRIYKIGTFIEKGTELKKLAEKNNKVLNDRHLAAMKRTERQYRNIIKARSEQYNSNPEKRPGPSVISDAVRKQLNSTTSQPQKRTRIIEYIIKTKSGDTVIGRFKAKKGTVLYIETAIGVIKVDENEIVSRKKLVRYR